MSMYGLFKTDVNLEKKGIIIDYGEFRVTIARAGGGNKKFAKLLEGKTKPYRRAIQTETMDSELAMGVLQKVYVDAVILNWETKNEDGEWEVGIEAPEGGPLLPFTSENILETFASLPDLFTDLQEQANKVALFRKEIMETDAGN